METNAHVWTSFAALRATAATWSAQEADEQRDVVVEGQLVHQRRISRMLSFYDLAEQEDVRDASSAAAADEAAIAAGSNAPATHAQPERLEVILKVIADQVSTDDIDAIRRSVNVGDVVRISGFLERSVHSDSNVNLLLHARTITTVRAWKDLHPNKPFTPAPTIRPVSTITSATSSADPIQPPHVVVASSDTIDVAAHCKFWINSRSCQYGDQCALVHASDADLKRARAAWLHERVRLKRLRAQQADDPLDAHSKSTKHQRARVFVDWLVAQFGVEYLSSGTGVVDVAGGRGAVSFELWNKRGIPCTLIDPRPLKLSKQQHKFLKTLQKHDVRNDNSDATAGASLPTTQHQQALVPQCRELFDTTTFFATAANANLLANASVLVGMHPDEATDAIVDVALQLDKPFVIVPCCVFHHEFPHRSKPNDGGRVVSYDDLVAYLVAKDATTIERAFLPFDGKNLVLYRRRPIVSSSSSSDESNDVVPSASRRDEAH